MLGRGVNTAIATCIATSHSAKQFDRPYALTSFNRHLRGKTVTKQSKRTDLCARRTGLANEQPPFDL